MAWAMTYSYDRTASIDPASADKLGRIVAHRARLKAITAELEAMSDDIQDIGATKWPPEIADEVPTMRQSARTAAASVSKAARAVGLSVGGELHIMSMWAEALIKKG